MNTQRLSSAVILVVDDDNTNREVLRHQMERQGAGVVTAGGGLEALEMLEGEAGRSFDAVLLDYMMPGIDGLEILRRIRKFRSPMELPVIMQTARTETSAIVECLTAGANDYVTKPIDLPVLLARLDTHLSLKRLSEEKDSFLAMASHDLKSPLATVRGFAYLLQEMVPAGTVMSDRAYDMLRRILRQSRTMERIVSDFLDMNAIENGQMILDRNPINLEELLRDSVESIRETASAKGINIRMAVDEEEGRTWDYDGDLDRLQQVVTNLLSNGVKFCQKDDIVEARLSWRGRGFQIDVSDSGPGVPATEVGRIFDKYTRLSTKPTGGEKSSGLGLCIARWLVELHGGRISVHNNCPGEGPDNKGRGATFRINLPVGKESGNDESGFRSLVG
jgi:signal transduction histidine kinase